MSEHIRGTEPSRRDPTFEPIPATAAQLEALARVVRQRSDFAAADRRSERRHDIDMTVVPMRARLEGGGRMRRCVGAYEISRHGLGALVRGAPAVSAKIRLWLRDRDGEEIELEAQIRWVRAIDERYQAMGVRFETPIDVRRFVPHATVAESGDEAA